MQKARDRRLCRCSPRQPESPDRLELSKYRKTPIPFRTEIRGHRQYHPQDGNSSKGAKSPGVQGQRSEHTHLHFPQHLEAFNLPDSIVIQINILDIHRRVCLRPMRLPGDLARGYIGECHVGSQDRTHLLGTGR